MAVFKLSLPEGTTLIPVYGTGSGEVYLRTWQVAPVEGGSRSQSAATSSSRLQRCVLGVEPSVLGKNDPYANHGAGMFTNIGPKCI